MPRAQAAQLNLQALHEFLLSQQLLVKLHPARSRVHLLTQSHVAHEVAQLDARAEARAQLYAPGGEDGGGGEGGERGVRGAGILLNRDGVCRNRGGGGGMVVHGEAGWDTC